MTKNARFLNIWEQWKLFVGKLSGNFKAQCPRRLGVRTPEPHSGNSGSNPLRVTKGINNARTTRYILVGVDDVEGPPVPIPNTVVKLNSAENTWLEAAREDRSTPTLFLIALIAQSVELRTVN